MRNKDQILLEIIKFLDVVKQDQPIKSPFAGNESIAKPANRKKLDDLILEYQKEIEK